MATGLFIGDERAIKSVYMPVDFEEFVNNLQARAAGLTAWDSAWFRSVIRKRANGARSIPRRIMRGETELNEKDFDGNLGNPRINFARLIEQASIALDLYGAAYLANVQNKGGKSLEVRWLDPRTITCEYDKATGRLLRFDRRVNGVVTQSYPYDEATKKAKGLAWAWSVGMNETGPGDTLTEACKMPATTLVMADEVMNGLFRRGAIDQLWITATNNPPEAEKERVRERIRRFMFGGAQTAHNVEIFNEGLVPTKIGTPPRDLELGPSSDRWQNDICAACDTPRILLNTVDASNRATIDRITQTWILTTIAPQTQMIVDALNFHVLHDLGYDLQLNTAGMDVDQAEESEKATAWATYVDRDVNPETAAEMLGIDIPEGAEFIDAAKVAERQAANVARMDALRQGAQAGPGNQPPQGNPRRDEEVKRLGEHIKSGAYLAKAFKSDILTAADIEAAIIKAEWEAYP